MIKPKNYEINVDITEKLLVRNKFKEKEDYFFCKKALYGNYIYLYIYINKPDYYLSFKVQDNEGYPYTPFYNPDDRHNNNVYNEVVKNYINFMDSLIDAKILKYKDESNYENEKENKKVIEIKYHSNIEKLKMTDKGDWCDLRVAEDTFVPENNFKIVSLGVSMKLPEGYEAHIVPRSSTFKNFGIIQTNHVGIIDNSYCGNNDIWKYPVYCFKGKDIVNGVNGTMLHKNDRICQFRIVKKQKPISFKEVDKLNGNDRGGFGSTGKN